MRDVAGEGLDVLGALEHIRPADLDYDSWLKVGMGLKEAGYSVNVWENWSRQDRARFHSGECQKKWDGFHGSDKPVTAGTIIQMALSRGWRPASSCVSPGEYGGHEMGWEDMIGGLDEGGPRAIVDRNWLEDREIAEPEDWDPVEQMTRYLEALFEVDENVGYVTRSYQKDGKYIPDRGLFDRTSGRLIQELKKCGGDIGKVIGDYDPEAGAWVRINPLDGKGVKDENVTDFRYALVESDQVPIGTQNAIIRELELPVAALVHSGNKSLHAIVRIEADDFNEYRKRVNYLYSICKKNGLEPDRQNRNPSRLSRLPGVTRKGNKQFLVDTNIGKPSWNEWVEWIESVNDDLPDPENMGAVWDDLPELAPPLIEGILRQGHKLLLAGPSKAGKSYALIELCCSIAEGWPWLGFACAQGKVMYVNLELDRASCLHRFRDVYEALGRAPEHLGNIDVWNLRGKSVPMDKLAPKLIRRAKKKNYIAVVIDPIYKVITGDENSADQMAKFCNQFDKVCTELGCAVIYCHHHSKGSQGSKRSMDRASGSGVFARDPDALLDLIELPVGEDLRKQVVNRAVGEAVTEVLRRAGKLEEASQDDLCTERGALQAAESLLDAQGYKDTEAVANAARKAAEARTAWRIDGTLREFPKFPPIDLWFDYPIHRNDESGVLSDIDPEGEPRPFQKGKDARKKQAEKQQRAKQHKYSIAIESFRFSHDDAYPTVKELFEEIKQSAEAAGEDYPAEKTVRNSLKSVGYVIDKNSGRICPESEKDW